MNKQEILTKAIEKAVEGGWNVFEETFKYQAMTAGIAETYSIDVNEPKLGMAFPKQYTNFIFSQGFLKAFFGEEEFARECCAYCDGVFDEKWQHHACEMLLSDDPIEYLRSFVETYEVKMKGNL